MSPNPRLMTLGMFMIDEFSFTDEHGVPIERQSEEQIGGAGTYASVGARAWLHGSDIGMIVDRGIDWSASVQKALESYGTGIWIFRDNKGKLTTRALNAYRGDHRHFEYLAPRTQITPRDLVGMQDLPQILHFICSPKRASVITQEVEELFQSWCPTTVYEPIPDRCVPEELPNLIVVLPKISILSPNAEEAFSLLSMAVPVTRTNVEEAARRFVELGVGPSMTGAVVIRAGEHGSYTLSKDHEGQWIDAFWQDQTKVVDVTGAGNAFLGGLAAGLLLTNGDVYAAGFHGAVSASYAIEQGGLPRLQNGLWNGSDPYDRLRELQQRYNSV
ncbi:Ribokinase-like protein [Fistulina hepatica ATCC 64428]|nr:Ribokinase-like protein [Fistulina hepatica ATCC 64428]